MKRPSFATWAAAGIAMAGCGGRLTPNDHASPTGPLPSSTVPSAPPVVAPSASSNGVPTPAPVMLRCGADTPVRPFASARMQAMALDGEWTTCSGHPLCPATDPYMMFDGQPTAGEFTPMARCGRWCGGSSESFCATKAPEYLFTFDVTNASATSSAYVLHLASAAGERRFSLVSRASMPAAIELTDSSTGAVLALEAIGSPVK